ncbi:MAG: 5'/3'-nucleotidase SurE [Bacteroidota bacterium]|nr:5'/3'-nucleotidase SurE [Bacteroidota bacterium]
MMEKKPLILVTNDDGIRAPGIRALIEVMRSLGKVIVVAPDRPQSGASHSITINVPLRLEKVVQLEDYEEYSCNGTPTDCVKLGIKAVMHCHPDLIVSGINHGSNASVNIIYSGTMAAVIEGCMAEIPSIGFSLLDYSMHADFKPSLPCIRKITEQVLKNGLPFGVCLNVNIPNVSSKEIRGIRVCQQAGGTWQEDFDERTDPHGRDYYWLKGIFVKIGDGHHTDEYLLENNYVSVVPVHTDMTAYEAIPQLKYMDTDA